MVSNLCFIAIYSFTVTCNTDFWQGVPIINYAIAETTSSYLKSSPLKQGVPLQSLLFNWKNDTLDIVHSTKYFKKRQLSHICSLFN